MGESSCQKRKYRNGSEAIDFIKEKIERCIEKYMSLEETMTYLQNSHQIPLKVTKLIWDRLQSRSPDFFKHYDLRCNATNQMKKFNELVAKQVALKSEQELHVFMNNLPDNTSAYMANNADFSGFPLPYFTNGPTVAQPQIPNGQQASKSSDPSFSGLPLPSTTVTESQIPNDQQPSTSYDPAYNYSGAPAVANPQQYWSPNYCGSPTATNHQSPTYMPDEEDFCLDQLVGGDDDLQSLLEGFGGLPMQVPDFDTPFESQQCVGEGNTTPIGNGEPPTTTRQQTPPRKKQRKQKQHESKDS